MSCIRELVAQLEKDKENIKDSWYENVTAIMDGSRNWSSFIGHCCEVREAVHKACVQATAKGTPAVIEPSSTEGEFYVPGLLHFPQLHILIDSPMQDYVDVHGLGGHDAHLLGPVELQQTISSILVKSQ